MSGAATAWAAWMAPMAWQAGVFILVVWALDRLLRRWAWPQVRHALWLVVALKLLAPPTLASPVGLALSAEPPPAPVAAFLAWLSGVALFGALCFWRTRRARRRLLAGTEPAPPAVAAAARAAAARLGLRRAPRVRLARCAAVFGLVRPVVLVPRGLRGEDLAHVLLHELAHVKRRDLWLQALFGLLHLVYWFHPLVWLARRRAYAAREICCDATVAAALKEKTPAYRATLLRLARPLAREPRSAAAAGFLFGPSTLLLRLRALEREPWRRPVLRASTGLFVAALLAGCLVPMAGAPPVLTELQQARALVARFAAHPDGASCLQMRFALMRIRALTEQAERSP